MDNNNPLMKKPPKQEKPKAQHRTAEQIAKEQAPTPNEIKTDLDRAREKAFAAYSEYMKLLTDRVLDQNKSKEKKDYEQFVVGEMYQSAGALDMISNGEGGMSLALIAVRSVLQMRDRFNELDSRINDIEKLLKRSVDKK